jgi:FixJ family two-component response regulator
MRSTQAILPTELQACVCVIDGDPAVCDSLATLVALNGHDVFTFATGREFLDSLSGRPIACVVCEAELPDTSGVELFRSFRPAHPQTRFALLMSRTDPAATALARASGVDAVFSKPLVHRRLIGFVNSA